MAGSFVQTMALTEHRDRLDRVHPGDYALAIARFAASHRLTS
jgi:hypothetical protein